MGFSIGALVGVLITFAGALTSEQLEKNKYAQVKDCFLEEYEAKQLALHPEVEPERPPCRVMLSYKVKALCKALQTGLLLKFFLF